LVSPQTDRVFSATEEVQAIAADRLTATAPAEGTTDERVGSSSLPEDASGVKAAETAPADLPRPPLAASHSQYAVPPRPHLRPADQRTTRPPVAESRASHSLSQSVLFLVTVALMFAAARYLLPTIVEEVRYSWHRGELRAEYESSGEVLKNASLDSLSQASEMVTQHAGPSVVHIEVQRALSPQQIDLANFLQERTGVVPPNQNLGQEASDQGSGVIVDADGYILTNEHVIADGNTIEVGLSDGRRLPAQIVGVDPLTDLAVLKINADRLIPIQFGESEKAKVGSPVWAIGSPFGLDRTVTFGILSGKHRVVRASTRYQDFMQSDVAVNPGNSGGPLVDARGKLIGINTAIVGDTYRGVSFSIPSDVAKSVYERIRQAGRVERGWLGVALTEVPDDLHTGEDPLVRGAYVTGLADSDSPAARANVQTGDIIVQIGETPLTDMGHLMRLVGNLAVGESVEMHVLRDGVTKKLVVTIGRWPEDPVVR